MDGTGKLLISMDHPMSIELTQKVIKIEKTLNELIARLENIEKNHTSEKPQEDKPRRGRRPKNENER